MRHFLPRLVNVRLKHFVIILHVAETLSTTIHTLAVVMKSYIQQSIDKTTCQKCEN